MEDRLQQLESLQYELTVRLQRLEEHHHREEPLSAQFDEQVLERQNGEVVDSLVEQVKSELVAVRHALQRIEDGAGERCEHCDQPITAARLQAMPQATLCVNCAD